VLELLWFLKTILQSAQVKFMDEKLFHFWDIFVTKIFVWENSLNKQAFFSPNNKINVLQILCKRAEAEPIEKLKEDKKSFSISL